jgi:hypothetical protein
VTTLSDEQPPSDRMCAKLTAARLSSSARADDPVIAGLDEGTASALIAPHPGYCMPAFAHSAKLATFLNLAPIRFRWHAARCH